MIPNIKAMIQVCVVICLTGSIKTFDIPYLMTQGGPGAESTFLSIYMYKEAFVDSSIGRGTAVAVCMLILALAVTMIVNRIFAFINRND
jgi:raffinose/stachyose/melibiose transport system permease protein